LEIVPASILTELYVDGSFFQIQNGFVFNLQNNKLPVSITKVYPLTVDGEAWPVASISFVVDGRTTKAENISGDKPFHVPSGARVMVQVMGKVLGNKPHQITLPVEAKLLGRLEITFTDKLQQGFEQETRSDEKDKRDEKDKKSDKTQAKT